MKEHVRSRNWIHNVNQQKESYFKELSEEQVRKDAAHNVAIISRRNLVKR